MSAESPIPKKTKTGSATKFFLRGLAISLPPILTLVILMWIANGIYEYIINPISSLVQLSFVLFIDRSETTKLLDTMEGLPSLEYCGQEYRITDRLHQKLQQKLQAAPNDELRASDIDEGDVYIPVGDHERSIPYEDYVLVVKNVRSGDMPRTVTGFYMKAATHKHFRGVFGISAFAVSISVLLLYYLGRIVTSRLGAWGFQKVESVFLHRLPVISTVYSSVKQVTDFLFSERTIEYNRVVAIEYPRRGIWSVGFVTGESMLEMTAAAGEPLVSVLVPTSPMPVTGYTMNVPKNEVLDLNITIDQAFQYCLSCGVLVPPQQKVTPELLQQELAKRLTGASAKPTPLQTRSTANSPGEESPTRKNPSSASDGVTEP